MEGGMLPIYTSGALACVTMKSGQNATLAWLVDA